MYRQSGYLVANEGMALAGPLRQILLSKVLAPAIRYKQTGETSATSLQSDSSIDETATGSSNGVYVWRTKSDRS